MIWKLCCILVKEIIPIENKEQGVFLTALIRNTTSQKQIRNNSLKQGTGGNPGQKVRSPVRYRWAKLRAYRYEQQSSININWLTINAYHIHKSTSASQLLGRPGRIKPVLGSLELVLDIHFTYPSPLEKL